MVRLVVSDVDGTLVEDGGSVESFHPGYYDAIRGLKEKGLSLIHI